MPSNTHSSSFFFLFFSHCKLFNDIPKDLLLVFNLQSIEKEQHGSSTSMSRSPLVITVVTKTMVPLFLHLDKGNALYGKVGLIEVVSIWSRRVTRRWWSQKLRGVWGWESMEVVFLENFGWWELVDFLFLNMRHTSSSYSRVRPKVVEKVVGRNILTIIVISSHSPLRKVLIWKSSGSLGDMVG